MPSSQIIPSSPTHAALPLAVAGISRDQAELARQIGRGRQAAVAPDAVLTLRQADAAAPSWLEPLVLRGGFGRIELVRGARLLRALTGIDLGDDPHGPQWEWLQAAVCARLAGTPLAGVDSLAQAHQEPAADLTTLRLTLRSAGHLITTHGRASAADWLRLLAGGDWLRLQSPLDAHAALPLRLPLRLARHRLPHAMLAGLRRGDVLLPDSPAFDRAGRGHLTLGGLHVTVRYQTPASLIILTLETAMYAPDAPQDVAHELAHELAHDAPPPPPQAGDGHGDQGADPAGFGERAAPAAALDQLPATLDIELGRLTLTLGALRSLGVGSTLLLAGADPAALEIRCAGRLLGRGEAVDVEGRLGVRITAWSAA